MSSITPAPSGAEPARFVTTCSRKAYFAPSVALFGDGIRGGQFVNRMHPATNGAALFSRPA
jgi:hypothetical protein